MQVADQIHVTLRRLHPDQRRAIKAALRALAAGGVTDSRPLTDNLEGFYRLRIGKFRIVYRFLEDGAISCEFIDVRETIYERFAAMRETLESPWSLNEAEPEQPRKRTSLRKKTFRVS